MTDGTSQGLFIVVAIVIFGIFVVLAYILFEDTLSPALASMFEDATVQANYDLLYEGFTPTDESLFRISSDGTLISYTGTSPDIVIPREVNGITVTRIGKFFHHAWNEPEVLKLNSVIIPDTVTFIGEQAFRGNNITKIVIPDSVTVIENRALEQLNRFGKVTTPKNVKVITEAQYYNAGVTNLTISKNVTHIESFAFARNSISNDIVIPDNVKHIGNYAFYLNNFKTIRIAKSVSQLGEQNFSNNPKLVKIYIPKELESVVRANKEILSKESYYDSARSKYISTSYWNIDEIVEFY